MKDNKNMKKTASIILLFIITAVITGSCSPVTDEIVDHGTFSGVPFNARASSIPVSGQAIDVDIAGNYAYLTNDLGVLYIIDISDRERPRITGKCRDIDSANIVIVEGDMAYVSYTEWIAGEDDYYTECGFKIVDISDKEKPEVIGNYISGRKDKKTVFGLYVKDDFAYLNTSTYADMSEVNTLEIVDIRKKSSPVLSGLLELPGSPANITVVDDTAYINVNHYDYDAGQYTDNSELIIVDISDRTGPAVADNLAVPANSWGIYQEDGLIYLSSHYSSDDGYSRSMIQLVDVSDEAPVSRGSISIPGGAWELDMTGGFLYVSDLTGGIYTIDVNNPDEPLVAGRLNTPGTSYDITLMGNYGYIADGFEGLVIMSLSDEEGGTVYEPAKQDNENMPPRAVLDIFGDTAGDYYLTGTPVILSAVNSFDPENEEISYSWDISGQKISGEKITDINFTDPGFYEVTLEVSDGELSDTVTRKIPIADIDEPIEQVQTHLFTIEIEYILDNQGQLPLTDIECLMRVPLSYEPYQAIGNITASVPASDEIYDNHKNKLLRFIIEDELAPGEQVSVLASFQVTANEFDYSPIKRELYYEEDDTDLYYYTRDDLYIDSDSSLIRDTVSKLIGEEKDSLVIAGILYDFVARNLYYDYQRAENAEYDFLSASEILEAGKGVCSDYSILYTALLRAAGIPARLAAGIPVYTILYEKEREIDIGHAWVEIKLPGHGWVPVDITTEEDFWASNYFLNIVTERGPGYIYEHSTMDWGSYYYDGFDYTSDGEGISPVEQSFIFRVRDLELADIEKD
jgi:PKD repeat protein